MKFRYILGNFGTGKFTTCINEILYTQKNSPNKTIIFIVPEQFSVYAERKLIQNIENNVLINIQVLSFKRLSYYIFSEIGFSNKVILEDYGQVMIIRKILHNIQENLLYFNNLSHNNLGTLEKILSIIQDFFKYNITLQKLDNFLNSNPRDSNLYLKIYDLKLIYKEYLAYINKDYITSYGVLDILAQNIHESNFIKGAEVWIYGFTNFTPQELSIISKLSQNVEKINIALHFNSSDINIKEISFLDNFYEIKNTIKNLQNIVLQNNLILEDVYYLNKNLRHLNNKELLFLSSNYFSHTLNTYNQNVNNIQIFTCENKYLEVENVAKKIIELVRDFRYNFKDIAIVIADLSYSNTIDFIFNKYSIPYFLDFKKAINTHPLTILIFSVLDIIIYNWNYDSVFQYLKTNFILDYGDENFKIQKEDIYLLENYVLAYGIKGYKWQLKSWEFGFSKNSIFDKDKINKTKEYVCKSLKNLDFNNKDKYLVKEISKKIIDFFMELNVLQTLEKNYFIDKGFLSTMNYSNTSKSEEHFQVWNSIILTMEKLVDILGDEKLTIEEYYKILKVGIEKNEIALYPQTQDQVIIGDFRRTRFPKIKAMFVLNLNQGVLPSFLEENDLISDTEKVTLLSKGIEVSPNLVQLLSQENLYIYSIIIKPTKMLFLSYLSSDLNGQSKKPSFVINRILELFPNLNIQHIRNLNKNLLNDIYTPKVTFENILEALNFISISQNTQEINVLKDIFSWFLKNNIYKSKIDYIQNSLKTLTPRNYLNEKVISKVYSNNTIFSSVSKLEKFNSCPFSYFLQYNLNLNERKLYDVNNIDFGLFYHSVLENFSNLVFNESIDYKNISYSQIENFIDISIKNYIENLDTDVFSSSKRYNYFLKNIKRISKQSSYAIIRQLKSGSFIPYGFEVEFKSSSLDYKKNIFTPIDIQLYNNYKMFLNGKIDRVDILHDNDNLYIKILDYKSSDKNLDFNNIYYGLQLQLILYLDAFIRFNKKYFLDKNILPGALFYFKLSEAILNLDKNINLDKSFDDLFNLKGFYADENVVKKGMDLEFKEDISKKIKGVSSSHILTQEQFSKLRNFVNILLKEIGTEITSGNIKIKPYKNKYNYACKYCLYKTICNIEILTTLEHNFNNLKNLKNEDIWNLIENKINQN